MLIVIKVANIRLRQSALAKSNQNEINRSKQISSHNKEPCLEIVYHAIQQNCWDLRLLGEGTLNAEATEIETLGGGDGAPA